MWMLWLVGCGGDDGVDASPAETGRELVEISGGRACAYGDGLPFGTTVSGETTFTADAPIDALVVLEECASGCADDITATCTVRLVNTEVVVEASGSYTVPIGPANCDDLCVGVIAQCAGPALPAGLWALDYRGGHSDGFVVPGTVPVPCATAL